MVIHHALGLTPPPVWRERSKVWRPLTPLLKEGDHVWFSPAGMLSRVNYQAVSNGHQRLSELYDLHQVSSTSNIAQIKKQGPQAYRDAVVYGGIEYKVSDQTMAKAAAPYNKVVNLPENDLLASNSVRSSRGAINDLPGTLEEAEAIIDVLHEHHVKAKLLQGSEANEESFKAMDGHSPTIIHIGTHGFMFSTYDDLRKHQGFLAGLRGESQKGSLMEWSGLLMAGAFKMWHGGEHVLEGIEDGILTAAEISRLDLSNTRLMVLSACETGLAMSTSADDLGLKRGLKNAGVETLVMSLWEVPDDATSLLMTTFFNSLTQGATPHRAMLEAQQVVRRKYPQPFFWAGFVVLD